MNRQQKAAQARRLRKQGMKLREIGERMGVAISTVWDWLDDPNGSKLKARKDSYRGVCKKCGAPTNGSCGRAKAPTLCLACYKDRKADRNNLLREMWEAGEPTSYIAEQLGMIETSVHSWLFDQRHLKGEKLPLRHLGGDALEREERHLQIVEWRHQGKTNAEIAELLGTTPESVSVMFTTLRRKGWEIPTAPRPQIGAR